MVLGFDNAPVGLGLSLVVIVQTVLAIRNGNAANFSLSHVLNGEVNRLITSSTAFENYTQLVVSIILIYMCRVFERHFGSRKFGAFIFFSWVLAIVLSVAIAVTIESTGILGVYVFASGPYFLVYSLLYLFHKSIPKLTPSQYTFLGLGISEKTWTYLLGAQLMLNAGVRSLIPSLVGLLVGFIYQSNHLNIQSWRLPVFVEKVFQLIFFFLPSGSGTPIATSTNGGTLAPSASSGRVTRSSAAAAASAEQSNPREGRQRQPSWSEATQSRLHDYGGLGDAIQPPTEEQIKIITDLGFDRAKAIHALEQSNNNVEHAANLLIR